MRTRSLLVLVALASGCYGGAWDTREVPPPSTAARDGATLTQYCTYHGATDLREINEWLESQARQGWQLVGVGGQTATMYCFKAVHEEPHSP
jgi:hypothetical protein